MLMRPLKSIFLRLGKKGFLDSALRVLLRYRGAVSEVVGVVRFVVEVGLGCKHSVVMELRVTCTISKLDGPFPRKEKKVRISIWFIKFCSTH
jgi:hypothetical protein